MKLNVWSRLLLASALAIAAMACDKDDNGLPPDYNEPNGSCLITASSDDIMGIDYAFNYNDHGNPVRAANAVISYDSNQRMTKADYSDGTTSYYREFRYRGRSFLPVSSQLYYQGALIQTELYTHKSGRLTVIDQTNSNQSVQNNRVYRITYDAKGNVKTVMQSGQVKPLYEGISYDDKPNIFGGNQWLRYLLFANESGYFLYKYQLLSENNPTRWALNDVDGALEFTATSTYVYNEEGYATSNTTQFQGPEIGELTGTQLNTFTCEN